MIAETFARFRTAATLPPGRWAAEHPGRSPMAVFCSYAPEELIHAAGFVPVRIRKRPPSSGAWGEHLQSYTCPLVRSLLEQGAEGGLAGFAGAVFAHSCDTMQALADIWRLRFPDQFVWVVNVPTRLDSSHSETYLLAELEQFQAALEKHSGTMLEETRLRDSIRLHNLARALLSRMDALRDRMSASDFYAAVLAAQTMPREEFVSFAARLVPALDSSPSSPARARVIVAGAILDDLAVTDVADELGIAIVGDDLCTGARWFEGHVRIGESPLAALAHRLLHRTPCAAKHCNGYRRGEALLELARQRQAQGVIFYEQKFCEPHAFDYAACQRFLRDSGVPVLLLEDDAGPATAQWRTRLQAFAEMLE